MQKNIIVVPDIHGRTFWKPLKDMDVENCDIIFLGDYVDPYRFDNINKIEAIDNFKEIIDFKKKYPDNVTLLLGNHDFGPYISERMPACRTDYENKETISDLFRSNLDIFDIGCYRTVNDKKLMFSHSCLIKEWVKTANSMSKDLFKDNSPEAVIDVLNEHLHGGEDMFNKILYPLSAVSRERGGGFQYGSIIWAHFNEVNLFDYEYDGWYQVFGHSQQLTQEMINDIYRDGSTDKLAEPIITKWFACLDCKQLFCVNSNGDIEKLNISDKV